MVLHSGSEENTERIGFTLGRRLDAGLLICLTGSLGSGKSVLARGICRGLGVSESVVSPSFILFEEYEGRLPVVHCDLYRLEHERDVEALGLFERIGGEAVVLVEWGDRSPRLIEAADIRLHLRINGETARTIEVTHRTGDVSLFADL